MRVERCASRLTAARALNARSWEKFNSERLNCATSRAYFLLSNQVSGRGRAVLPSKMEDIWSHSLESKLLKLLVMFVKDMQTRGSVFTRARYRLCLTVERFHLKVTLTKPSGSLLWGATQQGWARKSGCVWVACKVCLQLSLWNRNPLKVLKFPLIFP